VYNPQEDGNQADTIDESAATHERKVKVDEQTFIHDRYVGELIHGVFLPETAARVREIIEGFRAREGIDGLILGGTELPLLLRSGPAPVIPYLDTTKLHVERVVTEMLS
jgi:aspartate racemase